MNVKRQYRDPGAYQPVFERELKVTPRGSSRSFTLVSGMQVSVYRRPNLLAGRYVFDYAERAKDGTLFLHVEGPTSRASRRRMIREDDLRAVHVKSEGR